MGNIEILTADLKRNSRHVVRMSYKNSVLAFHSFKECPHIFLEVSMISKSEAEIFDEASPKSASSEVLKNLFEKFENSGSPFSLSDPSLATFTFKSNPENEFEVISSLDFSIDVKFGVFVEIFSSSYKNEIFGVALSS